MKHITWFQIMTGLEESGYRLDLTSIPDSVIFAESGRRSSARRQTIGTAGGRKRLADRCPCGKYTRHYAALQYHKCEAPPQA